MDQLNRSCCGLPSAPHPSASKQQQLGVQEELLLLIPEHTRHSPHCAFPPGPSGRPRGAAARTLLSPPGRGGLGAGGM